jgi:hypothetical protein|nr:MAG TPA: hypothetical protein [Caudoviricetes sp.]
MALRKIYLAVECANDQERDAVQGIANELSNMRVMNANSIIKMMPLVEKHKAEFTQLFQMITRDGISSLMSIRGGMLIGKLAKINKK